MRLKTIFEGVTVEAFMKSLRDKEVRFLVYKNLPGSRLSEIIRKIRAGRSGLTLEEVVPKPKKKSSETVVVYRVHGNEIASKHPRPAKRR
jgi:alkyl hydroperoxide reductase subunit AhpC